ncbi:MAG: hypothetical protein IT384_18100 [Deltaproteobacteria bacterium]|nr:hypothetical protein [Deltaproteobacteria bacterium]
MSVAVAMLSSNVTETRVWFDKVTAPGHQRTVYETGMLDAFQRSGVRCASDVNEASLGETAAKFGISADGLLSAMRGQCPFGAGAARSATT